MGSGGLGGSSEGSKGHQNLKGLGNLYVLKALLHGLVPGLQQGP